MTRNDFTNWILVNYTATSLYSVIANGNYRKTNVGRAEWMTLINDASLQSYRSATRKVLKLSVLCLGESRELVF